MAQGPPPVVPVPLTLQPETVISCSGTAQPAGLVLPPTTCVPTRPNSGRAASSVARMVFDRPSVMAARGVRPARFIAPLRSAGTGFLLMVYSPGWTSPVAGESLTATFTLAGAVRAV